LIIWTRLDFELRIFHFNHSLRPNLPTAGPMGKPRIERTPEYEVSPTCWGLGNQLCFPSMLAAVMKPAALLKVQTYWPRSERLAHRT
jgi:hypothetical protein